MLTDEELLNAVFSERRQSAGFEEDNILLRERELALNYFKGEMPDLPSLDNRSRAVATTIADAIETVLPDLVEIFVGGDDVVTFIPQNKDDEEQAQQETDYVRHVVFEENPGFLTLYSMFKDALLMKIGVVKFWWEQDEPHTETFTGKTAEEMALAAQNGQITDLQEVQSDQGLAYSFKLVDTPMGRPHIMAVPPEDFTVARDTVELSKATYCAFRSRPRAQDLKDRGVDPEIVDNLPAYGTTHDETIRLARDTAGEYSDQRSVTGNHDMRQVEVIEHFLRIDADGKGPRIWRIFTGGADTVMIEKEAVERIPFAAITPYIVPHRFYGESVADRLVEPQRQATALKRMLLDSGYFAMNQRTEVSMQAANEWTIQDLLRNEPAMPVRSKTGDAVRPLQAGKLDFDVLQALEYTATEVEQRTGIVRNAQGLNPDTLHETATGSMALMAAAQKRTRLIARVFAETGVKDLYLGVHALIRENADRQVIAKLRGKWVPVDPSQWGERDQMAIEVGLGSAGRHEEVAALTNIMQVQGAMIRELGPRAETLLTPKNIFNAASKLAEKSGQKNPEAFFTDPGDNPPPQQQGPSPEMIQAQQDQAQHQDKMQLQQQEQQTQAQLAAAKIHADMQTAQQNAQLAAQKAATDAQTAQANIELQREKLDRDDQFRYAQLAQQAQLAREERDLRMQLEREKLQVGFTQAVTVEGMKEQDNERQREADLAIQQSEAQDAKILDD